MEADLKQIIFLFLFVVVGVALFVPILSIVNNVTSPTIHSGNTTVTNPNYVGSNNAPLVSVIPIFYLLIVVGIPALMIYKIYKERE